MSPALATRLPDESCPSKFLRILVIHTEKAGVGGSTPSLATTFQRTSLAFEPDLPVRSQSATFRLDPVRFLAMMMVKDLNSNCLSLSPLLSAAGLKIATSIAPAAATRSSLTLWA